jgi:hypothetical protein
MSKCLCDQGNGITRRGPIADTPLNLVLTQLRDFRSTRGTYPDETTPHQTMQIERTPRSHPHLYPTMIMQGGAKAVIDPDITQEVRRDDTQLHQQNTSGREVFFKGYFDP